jgi:hypothetical protein
MHIDSCAAGRAFSHHMAPQNLTAHPRGRPSGFANAADSCIVTSAGFHTFDYARHFLSCCSRMLGVEHVTQRGAIMLE